MARAMRRRRAPRAPHSRKIGAEPGWPSLIDVVLWSQTGAKTTQVNIDTKVGLIAPKGMKVK